MMMLNRNENGFTLVEVLVSMAIFAFGILSVINMQLVASWTDQKARYMTEGIVVAQGQIEALMSLNYSDVSLADDEVDAEADQSVAVDASLDKADPSGSDKADHMDLSHPIYKLYWNVRPDYPFDGTKTVRVIVKWDEKALAKRFALDMVKSDGG